MMPEPRWQQVQRIIARKFGLRPAWRYESGADGKALPGETTIWALQVKHGKKYKLNYDLVEAMKQTVADSDGKCPVLVIHPFNYAVEDSWVIIPLWAFEEWFL